MQHRRLEGASTITQQVAKNFLLNSDVKFSRKIREAILAIRIDSTYPKEKILELYLNEIYLGENSYGVAAAALNYFGKSLDQLDIAEVAFLAALPKAPSNYDPVRNPHGATERRNWVIGQMADNGYITDSEAKAAIEEPLATQTRLLGSQAQDVDYYVEEIRRLLYAKYGVHGLYDGGLQVRSSLDTRLQNFAVSALRSGLVRYDRRHGWRGATKNIAGQPDWKVALAAIPNQSGIDTWRVATVLDFGGDRSVHIGLAGGQEGAVPFSELAWGAQANAWNVSRARSDEAAKRAQDRRRDLRGTCRRQRQLWPSPGPTDQRRYRLDGSAYGTRARDVWRFQLQIKPVRSRNAGNAATGLSFKPFVYAAALDNGFTPTSQVVDGPVVVDQGPGLGLWHPANFEHKFLGPVTLRRAIALSFEQCNGSVGPRDRHGQNCPLSRAIWRLRQATAVSGERFGFIRNDADTHDDRVF
ncbi:MAG: transglycosylase domain-containing protein [Rhizomicrobium sp.]